MVNAKNNVLGTKVPFETGAGKAWMYSLTELERNGSKNVSRLPFSIKVLLEAILREVDEYVVTQEDVEKLTSWSPSLSKSEEIPFKPARVILQDFTGVPAVVDLAAMRSAMKRMGGDPQKINPVVPVDLVIDHSVQVDVFGQSIALERNAEIEFARNRERYEFLRWGQQAFNNFSVVPPASGIVHQVNLEYIARGVWTKELDDEQVVFPDSLVGTDSHTTMINGLGIVGWGVGGIEAEAVMLGQPIYMLIPDVVGFRVTGALKEGVTATDLTLTVTEMLRQKGVVGKFVEFYGPGLDQMTLPDRATIANMAPEYGATMGFFPIDDESLKYLSRTGRSKALVTVVERYTKEQGLFRTNSTPDPEYSDTISLDLGDVEPSVAGPKRPQDRVSLKRMRNKFHECLNNPAGPQGFGLDPSALGRKGVIPKNGHPGVEITHGAVVLAAITSCTNTSNPSVMIAAGILAKKAVEQGLEVPPYVKTSMAPGSKVVTDYLNDAGLTPYLEQLGFHTVGYGCTTCIGNSGPLPDEVVKAITEADLIAAGVLSGNRNFEGRIHPYIKANYLASPPLVIAYALAGRVDIDFDQDPIGTNQEGQSIYLKDIWPSASAITAIYDEALKPETFHKEYDGIQHSNEKWNAIPVSEGLLYEWEESSTYIQEPPFFINLRTDVEPIQRIENARVLVKVANSVTTDHISPAGSIPKDMPAGKYLQSRGIGPKDFNSFGSRRGNDRVMTRGTFGNIRLRNQMAPGTEGGWTTYLPNDEVMSIFEASEKYQSDQTPLIVLAGKEYGTGSSRDWAAKGTFLLGVRVVLAESFERIHRSNLVGMGVLPLQFKTNESADTFGLTGKEFYTVFVDDSLQPGQDIRVEVNAADGNTQTIVTTCRVDTPVEVEYYRNGGILQTVLRNFLKES